MTVIERARRYVAQMPAAISGQHGHDTMFSVACALVQGFSLDIANARILLAEYNATLTEPFTEKEIDHKVLPPWSFKLFCYLFNENFRKEQNIKM